MARGQRDLGLERQWRERMAVWRASRLSVHDFCQQRGLTEPTFHYWRRELRTRDSVASTTGMSSGGRPPKDRPRFAAWPSTFCNRTRRSEITSAANASAQAGMNKSSNAFDQPFPTP